MAKKTMEIEVVLGFGTAQGQLRQFAAANGTMNVAVGSPVGATVGAGAGVGSAGGAGIGGATGQAAMAAAMQQAEQRAAMYSMPMGASSPNWSVLMQNAMTGAMYPQGASSPNWSMLLGQQTNDLSAIAAANAATRNRPAPRGRRTRTLGGQGTFRGVMGLMAASELNGALGNVRDSESAAMFAETPEDLALTYAEAYNSGSSGFFGSLLAFFPNLAGADWSPQEILRQAKDASGTRKIRDANRNARTGMMEPRARRRGYARSGEYGADVEGLATSRDVELADLKVQARDLDQLLNAREPSTRFFNTDGSEGYSQGQYVIRGEARAQRQDQRRILDERMSEVREQAGFDYNLMRQERSDWQGQVERAQSALQGYIGGESNNAQRRRGIRDSTAERTAAWGRARGQEGRAASEMLGALEQGQEEFDTARRRFDTNDALDASTRQLRYRRGGPGMALDARLDEVATQAIRETRELERQGDPDQAARRRRLGQLEARGARDDYLRSFQFSESSPNRTFGSIDLGDIDKKLRDAQKRIGESAEDPMGGGGEITALLKRANALLQKMADGFYPAKVR